MASNRNKGRIGDRGKDDRRDGRRGGGGGRGGGRDNRGYGDLDDSLTSVAFQDPRKQSIAVNRADSAANDMGDSDDASDPEKTLHQLAKDGNLKSVIAFLSSSTSSESRVVNRLDSDSMSALHYAARYGHLDVVRELVRSGADPCIKGLEEITPLHLCAKYKLIETSSANQRGGGDGGYQSKQLNTISEKDSKDFLNLDRKKSRGGSAASSVIHFLASKGAKVNEKDRYGLTPLHYASMRGNNKAVVELLECKDVDIESRDEQLLTPLHLACTYGMVGATRILLENGASLKNSGERKQTALHKACAVGMFNQVEMITYAAVQVYGKEEFKQMLREVDVDSNTPLLLAVESGSVDIVQHLVELGADVNQCNKNRVYPLHLACTNGSLEIVKLLLHNKAIINNVNQYGRTPLMVASRFNSTKVIEYLLKKGAKIEKTDKNSLTPLLLAAYEGNPEAVDTLLDHGANIFATDREDKSALFWAAANNHHDTVKVLLKDRRSDELLETGDRRNNTPLHVAAQNGFLEVAVALLDANADVDVKNEDEESPLHLAAKEGRNRLTKELLKRDKYSVNDEDSNSNTALHLACTYGHHRVVSILIDAGAEIEAKNYHLWTPLDCAAAHGQPKCAKLLMDAGCELDPVDKNKTTPLHLAAKYGNEKTASLLVERGASLKQVNSDGHNALTIAILHGKRDVAGTILDSDRWMNAMKSQYISPTTGVRETPLRLLIKQFPELAKKAFDRCVENNLRSESKELGRDRDAKETVTADDPRFAITLNYEMLDDTYCLFQDVKNMSSSSLKDIEGSTSDSTLGDGAAANEQVPWIDSAIFNEQDRLVAEAKTYHKSTTVLKLNHPLMIMVKEGRTNLLGHPLCMALVRHKWNNFGRHVYYFTLAIYFIYVIFLTDFIINTPAPYSSLQITSFGKAKNSSDNNITATVNEILYAQVEDGFGYGSEETCRAIRTVVELERKAITSLGRLIVVVLAGVHLVKEIFQFLQGALILFFQCFLFGQTRLTDGSFKWARITYFGIENLIEWTCYVTAILFVLDLTDCHKETGLREDWQWQIGAISITASWLNLLSNVRKFPFLGIYVVMFADVFKTFLKFSLICALFIVAFSLGFHALLAEQDLYMTVSYSFVKTAVMMIGDLSYDSVFFDTPQKRIYEKIAMLPYRTTTLLFFLVFVIIMAIIVMNLLVGLAVDNIKDVQDNAVLQRLAMQVELNLDVEKMLPGFIRRKFTIRRETVHPNGGGGIVSKMLNDDTTLRRISLAVIEHGSETEMERLSMRIDDILEKIKSNRESFSSLLSEQESMKSLLGQLARFHGMDYEEEDGGQN